MNRGKSIPTWYLHGHIRFHETALIKADITDRG